MAIFKNFLPEKNFENFFIIFGLDFENFYGAKILAFLFYAFLTRIGDQKRIFMNNRKLRARLLDVINGQSNTGMMRVIPLFIIFNRLREKGPFILSFNNIGGHTLERFFYTEYIQQHSV